MNWISTIWLFWIWWAVCMPSPHRCRMLCFGVWKPLADREAHAGVVTRDLWTVWRLIMVENRHICCPLANRVNGLIKPVHAKINTFLKLGKLYLVQYHHTSSIASYTASIMSMCWHWITLACAALIITTNVDSLGKQLAGYIINRIYTKPWIHHR